MRRGTRVGQAYVSVTADGDGINDEIADAFDDAGADVERAGEDHGKRYGNRFSEGFSSRLDKIRDRIGERLGSDLGKKVGAEMGDRLASNPEQIRRGVTRAFDDNFVDRIATRFADRFTGTVGDELVGRLELSIAQVAQAVDNLGSSNGRAARTTKELETRFDRVNARLSEFEDLTGRITGRGSRNNFLNFIGSVTRNATRLLGVLPRLGAQFADVFSTAFSSRGGGLSGVLAGLTASGSFAVKGLASNAATLGGALVALTVIIGPLVAAMSLLLGTVTALAASLTFALAGAVAALTAAFVPFVAGIGVATLAIQGLDKAQKRILANDFKPLVEQAKDLRSALADAFVGGFDSEGVSGNLTKGLQTVQPLLEKIAVAVGDVFERFASIGTSPAFRQFISAMESVLPQAVRNLGNGLAGFTEGFLGVFRALAPTIESVAQSISDAGDRFSEWANSAAGQRSLTEFFDNAAESLSVVKDFLGEVGGLIGDLFSAGRGTGDSLFTSLTDAVAEFRDFIDDGEIQKWFEETGDFARTLGDAFVAVMKIVDQLDSDFNRAFATGTLKVFIAQFMVLEEVMKGIQKGALILGGVFVGLGEVILLMLDGVLTGFGNLFGAIIDDIGETIGYLENIPGLGDTFKGWSDALDGAADNLRGLNTVLDGSREKLKGTRKDIQDMISGVSKSDLGKLDLLRDRIENIPDRKITELVAEGEELSTRKIRRLIKEYGLTPSEVNTLTRLLGDEEAKAKIGDLMRRVRELDDAKAQPTLSANPQPAITAIQRAIGFLNIFDRDRSVTLTTVYRTRREAGGSPGLGPQSLGERSSAGRTVSTLPEGAAGRMASTLQRSATDAVSVLPEIAARASAEAEKKGKKAAKGVEAAFKNINKRLAASIQRSTKGTGAEEARSAVQAAIERLRGYIGENGKNKKAVQSLAKDLREQTKVSQGVVKRLVSGRRAEEATLADFAAARARLASKIEKANDQLAEALAIRDDFAASVSDSVRDFGSILGAQASVIDGVTQDLTATDITSNLQSRLDKIRKFQENLRILLAQGLSDDAYKQLVEAGVENGSAYVEALVNGQAGTIDQVNSLVGQIGSVADQLGLETSNRLYQAGVDAAQGLVDGLESMSERLDNAAAKLGASIARAITRALGLGDGPGGDGKGNGKGNGKNDQSGRRASEYIFPTPAAATYSTAQRNAPEVSGNGMRDVNFTVVTPTQDPRAVAVEALNEMTGRLL